MHDHPPKGPGGPPQLPPRALPGAAVHQGAAAHVAGHVPVRAVHHRGAKGVGSSAAASSIASVTEPPVSPNKAQLPSTDKRLRPTHPHRNHTIPQALECHIVTPDFDSAVLVKKQIWPPASSSRGGGRAAAGLSSRAGGGREGARASKLQAAKRLAESAQRHSGRRRGRRAGSESEESDDSPSSSSDDEEDADFEAEAAASRGRPGSSGAGGGGGSGSSSEDDGDVEELEDEGRDGVAGGRRRGRRGDKRRGKRARSAGRAGGEASTSSACPPPPPSESAGAAPPPAAAAAAAAPEGAGTEMERQVMATLEASINKKGGQLPPGWTVRLTVRVNGGVIKTFISPAGGRFRGHAAVARELGLVEGERFWGQGNANCAAFHTSPSTHTSTVSRPKPTDQPDAPKRPAPGGGPPAKRARILPAPPPAAAAAAAVPPHLAALRREALLPLEVEARRLRGEAPRAASRRRLARARKRREQAFADTVGDALAGEVGCRLRLICAHVFGVPAGMTFWQLPFQSLKTRFDQGVLPGRRPAAARPVRHRGRPPASRQLAASGARPAAQPAGGGAAAGAGAREGDGGAPGCGRCARGGRQRGGRGGGREGTCSWRGGRGEGGACAAGAAAARPAGRPCVGLAAAGGRRILAAGDGGGGIAAGGRHSRACCTRQAAAATTRSSRPQPGPRARSPADPHPQRSAAAVVVPTAAATE
jgi:hypothetical protein